LGFIGKIIKIRGNKGEVVVKISPGADTPAIREKESIVLESEKYRIEKTIEGIRDIQGKTVLKLSGVNSIEEAMKLIGYSVFGAGESSDSPGALIDYRVVDLNRKSWGRVVRIRDFGLNRVMEVESRGDIIYVPLDKGIVQEIRDDQKLIVIDPPEGLKNLNR
jgi:16S rRNA processing protein RimM